MNDADAYIDAKTFPYRKLDNEREVYVRNEQRTEGNYSIYVRNAHSQMSWYTGLTFGNKRDCDKMVGVIRSLWAKNV